MLKTVKISVSDKIGVHAVISFFFPARWRYAGFIHGISVAYLLSLNQTCCTHQCDPVAEPELDYVLHHSFIHFSSLKFDGYKYRGCLCCKPTYLVSRDIVVKPLDMHQGYHVGVSHWLLITSLIICIPISGRIAGFLCLRLM